MLFNRREPFFYCALCSVRYRWTKDGEDFVPPRATGTKTQRTAGSFVLHNKQFIQFEGTYRCYAYNKLGTAMTEEISLVVPSEKSSSLMLKCCLNLLLVAILHNCSASVLANCLFFFCLAVPKFPKVGEPPTVVDEGEPITLHCDPPKGAVPHVLYWMSLGETREYCVCVCNVCVLMVSSLKWTQRV